MEDHKDVALIRTFSSSNLRATNLIHQYISDQERSEGVSHNLARDVTKSSMIIPTFKGMYDVHPRLPFYILNSITDCTALINLEKEGSINWCSTSRTFFPLHTEADGNCLFHAISVFIWGIHDRKLNLRRFVQRKLVAENRFNGKLYLRWKYEQEQALHSIPNNFDSGEVRKDWDEVVQASSTIECPYGNRGLRYSGLEDIHIFTACIVLARPIIVLCDKIYRGPDGRSLQPSRMGGIYLPLLRDPLECEKSPIVIGYWQSHFVPLLNCEDVDMHLTKRSVHPDAQLCVPLLYKDLSQIPIRFTLQNEDREMLLLKYLDCSSIPLRDDHYGEKTIRAAVLKFKPPPAWSVELMWSLFSRAQGNFFQSSHGSASYVSISEARNRARKTEKPVETGYKLQHDRKDKPLLPTSVNATSQSVTTSTVSQMGMRPPQDYQLSQPCQQSALGCQNRGNPSYNNLCQECYDNFLKETSHRPASRVSSNEGVTDNISTSKQSAASQKQFANQCATPNCRNRGFKELHDLCTSCYTSRLTSDRPHSARVQLSASEPISTSTSSAIQGNIAGSVSESLPALNDMISHLSELNIKPKASTEKEPTVPKASPKARPYVKSLCANAGCQEPPILGLDVCRYHKTSMPDCITEGCANKAADIEVPLCDSCKQKQVDAESSRLEDQKPIKAGFNTPQIYPTFPETKYEVPTVPNNASYDVPEWHRTFRGSGIKLCNETLCTHFAVSGKDGYCNECYEQKNQTIDLEGRTGKCLNPSCDRKGDPKFGGFCIYCFHPSMPPNSPLESEATAHIYDEPVFERKRPTESKDSIQQNVQRTKTGFTRDQYQYDLPIYTSTTSNIISPLSWPEVDEQTLDNAYENLAYEPGKYSLASNEEQKDCVMNGCKRPGKEENKGLCDQCYVISQEEELARTRIERRKRFPESLEANSREEELARTMPQRRKRFPVSLEENSREQNPSLLASYPDARCKSIDCPYPGVKQLNGYCDSCYIKETTGSGLLRETAHDPHRPNTASPTYSAYRNILECSTPGCTFYASPEYGPYCSKCFLEKTKVDTGANSTQGKQQQTTLPSQAAAYNFGRGPFPSQTGPPSYSEMRSNPVGALPCRKAGCLMFGRPEQDGYCSRCYR